MAKVLALALVLVVIAAGESVGMVGAQSPPPNSSSSCSAALVSLAPCLTFLQGGQNDTSPAQGCCTALASIVNTSAACLCQVFTTTNNSLGITINQTRALALPGACKITTSLSQCKSSPVSSPPVVSNPTPTAKSPATSATGGALSPSTKERPTISANAGSMMGVSTLIHVVGIMGSLTFILSASSI
eukprot:PITA_35602